MRFSIEEQKKIVYTDRLRDGQDATAAANATFVLIKQVAHEQIAAKAATAAEVTTVVPSNCKKP